LPKSARNLLESPVRGTENAGLVAEARQIRPRPYRPSSSSRGLDQPSKAAPTASAPGPLTSTLVSPSTPAASSDDPDQQRSSGAQSRGLVSGNALETYRGTASRHSAASSGVSQRRT